MTNGKGSKPRPTNLKAYNDNYDFIFENSAMEFHESKQFEADGQKVVLVDIDETICFYGEKRRYDLAVPNQVNIDKINNLHDEGWYVIYWTARGGSEKSKRDGKCYYDFTWKQLESWGCKFHDLSTGSKGRYMKPACDMVIDDKAKRIEEI
jgi:hypothetical protein